MNQLPDEYFDLKCLSTYSKLGVSTLRYHIRENDLPWFRIPGKKGNTGKILIKRSEFDNWMERFRGNDCLDPDVVADEVIKSLSD
jgi:hypothetical protein